MIIEEKVGTFAAPAVVSCILFFRNEQTGAVICEASRGGSDYETARLAAYVEAATQMAIALEERNKP